MTYVCASSDLVPVFVPDLHRLHHAEDANLHKRKAA
jgi:hypothetical protein